MLFPILLAALAPLSPRPDGPSRTPLDAEDEPPAVTGAATPARVSVPPIGIVPPSGYRAEEFLAFVRRPGAALSRRAIHARGRRLTGEEPRPVLSTPPGGLAPSAPAVVAVVSDDGLFADALPLPGPDGAQALVAHPRPCAALSLDVDLAPNPRADVPGGDWGLCQENGPVVELVRTAPTPGYAGTYDASAREELLVVALPPGSYRARVWADAYEPAEVAVELAAGRRTQAGVELRPLSPDERADLRVRYVFADGPHPPCGGSSAEQFIVEVRPLDRGPASWVQRLDLGPCAPAESRAPSHPPLGPRLRPAAGDGRSALSFALIDLTPETLVVRTQVPAQFSAPGQVVATPGQGILEIPIVRRPRHGGFGFRVVDATNGRELGVYRLSARRAAAPFPLPVGRHASGEGLMAELPAPAAEWRIDAPGFAPAFGSTDAFRAARIVTVELRPGWGAEIRVQDPAGAPLPGAPILADGRRVATTDAAGRATVVLPVAPASLAARHLDWVPVEPRADAPEGRIVLAPPL